LLETGLMHDASDFSLRITVSPPEDAEDDVSPTRPFVRPELPGVDLRQTQQRAEQAPRLPPPPPAPEPLPPPPTLPRLGSPLPRPPQAPEDDEKTRVERRERTRRRQVWARNLLRRFNFERC